MAPNPVGLHTVATLYKLAQHACDELHPLHSFTVYSASSDGPNFHPFTAWHFYPWCLNILGTMLIACFASRWLLFLGSM